MQCSIRVHSGACVWYYFGYLPILVKPIRHCYQDNRPPSTQCAIGHHLYDCIASFSATYFSPLEVDSHKWIPSQAMKSSSV